MKRGIFFLCVLILIIVPLFAFAQTSLVSGIDCSGPDCQACNVVKLIDNVIRFIIAYVAVPTLGILVAYAGFLYFSSAANPDHINRARHIFFSTIIGFLLMLGGWLIVDTIIKTLVGNENIGGYGPWYRIQCVTQPDKPSADVQKQNGTVKETPLPEQPAEPGRVPDSAKLSDAAARELLDRGITVAQFTQDSFDGVRKISIEHANAMYAACGDGCLTVTGAVGPHAPGTYSHANGFKLDFAPTQKLEDFITQNSSRFRQVIDRPGPNGGKQYVDTCGNAYVREKDHWDVTIYRACAF